MRDRRSTSSKFPLLAIVAVLVASPFVICCGGCLVVTSRAAWTLRKQEEAAKKELVEGNRLWDAGQKTAAVSAYKSVLNMNVRNVPSQAECATVYQRVIDTDIERGESATARQMIERALNSNVELRRGDDAAGRLLESVLADIQKQRSIELAQRVAKQEQKAKDDKLAKDVRDAENKQRDEARAERAKKDEEARGKRDEESMPGKGKIGYISVSGEAYVWVAVNSAAMKELTSFSNAKNAAAIEQMMLQGRVLVCARNTQVTVVDPGVFTTTVRMMEGKHEGRTGIIDSEFVHKAQLDRGK